MSLEVNITASAGPRNPWRDLFVSANPFAFVPDLWRHRHLIRQLTWREITGRYRSSVLGFAWSFATPLVTLVLYTFLFGVVFKARWPGARTDNLSEFGLMIFAGITAFALFSECVNRAPGLIAASPNYVKKVVFPLEVLPVTILGSAVFHTGISVLLLLTAHQAMSGGASWSAIWAPVVFVPVALLSLGVSWALASLGVFLRDIGHTTALLTQVLFFATPIFYPREALPLSLQPIASWNPLSAMVENVRRVTVLGLEPRWADFGVSLLVGVVVFCLGHAWFATTKRAFADVI